MALYFPQARSVNKFVGGYKAVSDYTDLADTETNNSRNVLYGPDGDLTSRRGSEKLNRSRLTNTSSTAGAPVTGHYYFHKTNDISLHVVVVADTMFNYTSATANAIFTGLSGTSEDYWQFAQMEDPRSAGDDIILATNGVDPVILWNGSATAIYTSDVTSATQVPIGKYILTHKNKVYISNIIDSADSDSEVKVVVSGFGSDGAANPHRFLDFFYLGGADGSGDIRGQAVLNDQIVFYTRQGIWKFNPGAGDELNRFSLQKMKERIGLLAPLSLVNTGDFHIFLSERGIQAFDGVSLVHLSEKVDDDLFNNSSRGQLSLSKGVYNADDNLYILYYPETGSTRNNRALIYDLRLKVWQPPITGRQVSYLSTFDDSNGKENVIYGDYKGYLYRDFIGTNDGISTGFNGTIESATTTTLADPDAMFNETGDGLSGLIVRIYDGTGVGQERVIESNTSGVLTLESQWTALPDTSSLYTVAGIQQYWQSKDYDFGGHDLVKLFRLIDLRVREEGDFNLTMNYIVDFNAIDTSTSVDLKLLADGFAWGAAAALWGSIRWGGRSTIRKKISLRSRRNQRLNGTHLALRFTNERANESFKVSGFDITLKELGRR